MKMLEMNQSGLIELSEDEKAAFNGGNRMVRALIMAATFMTSPALGMFHLGVSAGYREEAK